MENLLRDTITTAQPGEICFTYTPKQRVDADIFAARFGPQAKIDGDGVTYSLDKTKLHLCFKPPTPVLGTFNWKLSIAPYAERNMTSVIVKPASVVHDLQEEVTAIYAPEHAASTAGASVVHFFSEAAAIAFKQHLRA